MEIKLCPKCGKIYAERPALSRKDNNTEICPDCGILEALEETNDICPSNSRNTGY